MSVRTGICICGKRKEDHHSSEGGWGILCDPDGSELSSESSTYRDSGLAKLQEHSEELFNRAYEACGDPCIRTMANLEAVLQKIKEQ